MSGICGAFGQHTGGAQAVNLPCARETHSANPANPAKSRSEGRKACGVCVQDNPLNPAALRGLRVMQVVPAGFENAATPGVRAGQHRCCGVCGVCGVTFGPTRIARDQRRQRVADRKENVLKAASTRTVIPGGCQQLTFDDLPDVNSGRAVATIASILTYRPGPGSPYA